MSKKKPPVLSTVLYALAGLLGIYTIWAAARSFGYVSTMVAQHQLVISGNVFEIASFHMSNFGQYAFFAVILFALGRIVQNKWSGTAESGNQVASPGEMSDADTDETDKNDFEDWFQNNDK